MYVLSMPMTLEIRESPDQLKAYKRRCPAHLLPRVKMLQLLAEDNWLSNQALADRTGASLRTIARWVKIYSANGIDALLLETRGGDQRTSFTEDELEQIRIRLSDPKDCFTSYVAVVEWINTKFGVRKSYSTINQMLKRRFGTKLKVGRKSHVKKDEAAVAVFKKPARGH